MHHRRYVRTTAAALLASGIGIALLGACAAPAPTVTEHRTESQRIAAAFADTNSASLQKSGEPMPGPPLLVGRVSGAQGSASLWTEQNSHSTCYHLDTVTQDGAAAGMGGCTSNPLPASTLEPTLGYVIGLLTTPRAASVVIPATGQQSAFPVVQGLFVTNGSSALVRGATVPAQVFDSAGSKITDLTMTVG